jgi:uncharacterized protein (DUF1330 family)
MAENKPEAGIILLAKLFIHPGRETEFRQFETQAARIMQKYGGRIERVIRPTSAAPGEVLPHEIHMVSFPNMTQFESYRGDSDLAQLGPLRQAAIAKTEVIIGEQGESYS